ncbi:MAG: MFS transporter [Patescibacteria group bacterium]
MQKIFYGWWIVLACFFITFYTSGAVILNFTAFFEPISKEFGWSYTAISVAASIRGLEQGLFAPVMGFLVDRLGARKLLFSGVFTMGLGLILLSLTNSLPAFYGATVVLSIGFSACTWPVIVPAVANWFKKDMGKALGIISSGVGVGGLLVPVTVMLINYYQWRATFIILGIGMWLFGIPLIFIIRRSPEKYGFHLDGKSPDIHAIAATDQDRDFRLKDAIRSRAFWHISIADAIRLMAMTALITHILPYLNSMGISRSKAAFVATLTPVLSIVGRLVFGWLGDTFSKNHVLALAYILGGISFLSFSYVHVAWLIIPFLIFFPLSWGAAPLRDATMREYFGRASLGSIMGIMAGIGTVARISGPFLAGWTYDTFGDYRFIWLFFAASFAICVILMLTLQLHKKPDKV